MGYYSYFSGRIAIEPPLTWGQMRGTSWADEDARSSFRIEVDQTSTQTDEGELTSKHGVAVVPLQEDPYKGYDAEATLGEIVDSFPNHNFSGEIRVEGEESGDIWRLRVEGGKVVREDALVTWPDGTLAGGR